MDVSRTELERIGHMLNIPYLHDGLAYEILFAERHTDSGHWTLEIVKVDKGATCKGETCEESNCEEG